MRKNGIKNEQGIKRLRNRAEKSLRKSSADLRESPVEDVQKLVQELRVHQVELEMQNEELRKAQVELVESRDRYSDLYDFAPVGYFTLDKKGLIVEVNLAGADLLGFERASLIKKGFSQFVAPSSQDAFYSHRKRALDTGSKQTCELKLVKKNGEGFHAQLQTAAVGGDGWNFNQLRTAVIDITERKRAEELLEASNRLLESANSYVQMKPLLQRFVAEVKRLSGCGAAGVRLLDEEGKIPYEAYEGFSRRSYESESPLSINSDKCMCTNVIKGTVNPKLSFYTKGGSFYTNGTTRFLATVSEKEKGPTRNVCSASGYESVALVPIRMGRRILGLIHVADPQENKVPLELVGDLERLGIQMATSIQRVRSEEDLRAAHEELERRVEERTAELASANLFLKEEIDQRSRTEHALQESEEKYRIVVENANDGIVVTQDAEFKFANVKLETISGYSREELIGMPLVDLVHPDDTSMVLDYHQKAVEGREEPRVYNLRILDKDGHTKWLRNNRVLIEWGGRPATLNFLSDITAQMRAEQALRESEEQFKNIFLESPIGIAVYDSQGLLRSINKSCLEIYGASDESRIRGVSPFSDPNLDSETKEKLRAGKAVRYETAFDFEKVVDPKLYETTKAGTRYLDVLVTPLGLRQGKSVTGYLAQVQDITDRKRAEDNIHALSQQLMRAHESERQMISRELHDRVGQDLSTLKIGLDTLFDDRPEMPRELREKVSGFSRLIQKTIAGIRDLAYDLRPPGLDQLGFVQTISQYCEDFSKKTGLDVDLTSTGIEDLTLDSDAEINLYRLIQEGLNNIHKHAQAKQATLRMVASFPEIILRIEDDGIGFDTLKWLAAAPKEKRMGLRSMQERANLLGGKMRIQSRPGNGTKILVEIPYTERKNGSEEKGIDC